MPKSLKTSILLCALAALCALSLAGCGSKGSDTQKDTTKKDQPVLSEETLRCTAYLNECLKEMGEKGESINLEKNLSEEGMAYADLLDFDKNGVEELITVSKGDEYALKVKVFTFADGQIANIYDNNVSSAGTNGYFPYLEIRALKDGGFALVERICTGSAPYGEKETMIAYKNGQMTKIAYREVKQVSPKETKRYIEKGGKTTAVSEKEHAAAFDKLCTKDIYERFICVKGAPIKKGIPNINFDKAQKMAANTIEFLTKYADPNSLVAYEQKADDEEKSDDADDDDIDLDDDDLDLDDEADDKEDKYVECNVSYVDENGKSVFDWPNSLGTVGDAYVAVAKEIPDYTLIDKPIEIITLNENPKKNAVTFHYAKPTLGMPNDLTAKLTADGDKMNPPVSGKEYTANWSAVDGADGYIVCWDIGTKVVEFTKTANCTAKLGTSEVGKFVNVTVTPYQKASKGKTKYGIATKYKLEL